MRLFLGNFRELKKYQYDYDLKTFFSHSTSFNIVIYAACDYLFIDLEEIKETIIKGYGIIKIKYGIYYFNELISEILLKYSVEEQNILKEFCEKLNK